MYAATDEEVCVARNTLAVVTYWCQGKHKCEFRTSDIEAAATFKQFFLPGEFDVNSVEEAMNICHDRGGSLALLQGDNELMDVRKLFQRKKGIIDKDSLFWIHPDSEKYFQNMNRQADSEDAQEKKCVVLEHEVSTEFDFKVCRSY